jgi:hypothetical protein
MAITCALSKAAITLSYHSGEHGVRGETTLLIGEFYHILGALNEINDTEESSEDGDLRVILDSV